MKSIDQRSLTPNLKLFFAINAISPLRVRDEAFDLQHVMQGRLALARILIGQGPETHREPAVVAALERPPSMKIVSVSTPCRRDRSCAVVPAPCYFRIAIIFSSLKSLRFISGPPKGDFFTSKRTSESPNGRSKKTRTDYCRIIVGLTPRSSDARPLSEHRIPALLQCDHLFKSHVRPPVLAIRPARNHTVRGKQIAVRCAINATDETRRTRTSKGESLCTPSARPSWPCCSRWPA